jgi:hypothetical protein
MEIQGQARVDGRMKKYNINNEKSTSEKLLLFRSLFTGLKNVYGTYDPASGRATQVKAPVTDKVLLNHLTGRKPYGVYLLVKDRTRATAVDFDTNITLWPRDFVSRARHYGISAYIERSKSKGHHVWIFFEEKGVLAFKARLVVHHILDEIDKSDTEVFPKQDALDNNIQFGNFINAPLFGRLIPRGKTVFVDPKTFKPYSDQWILLESIRKTSDSVLDEIIEINDLSPSPLYQSPNPTPGNGDRSRFSLPPCAQKMLKDGVVRLQRVSCFRLAVHLKRLGLPYDVTVAALKTWALKNRPIDGKGVIRDSEILSQSSCAYEKSYVGYGCESAAIKPFCDPACPVRQWRQRQRDATQELQN